MENNNYSKGVDDRTVKYSQVQEFISKKLVKKIKKGARQAVSRGESWQNLSKQVYDLFKEIMGNYDFIEFNGEVYRIRKFADLFARYEFGKAQIGGKLSGSKKSGNDLIEISDHGTECDICKEFEGKIYSISGKNKTYPKLEKMPPFHLGCGHSLLPTSEEAIEVRKKYK